MIDLYDLSDDMFAKDGAFPHHIYRGYRASFMSDDGYNEWEYCAGESHFLDNTDNPRIDAFFRHVVEP